jgi:radical SAM superfamily enzyme YgiQ (UPF0313 family)
MNVLIVSTNRTHSPNPVLPSGACLVAEAAEKDGHRVNLLDLMFARAPLRALESELKRNTYDVIGLSIRNIDNNDMNATAFYIQEVIPIVKAIRALSDAPVIAGGAALVVMPEAILRAIGVSAAVVGDGEAAFCRMLRRIEEGLPYTDLPGVASLSQDGKFTCNPSPPASSTRCMAPAYDRWLDLRAYRSRMATVPLQTKQGCRFQCVYCTYRKIEGETYRLSDTGSVADAALRLASSGMRDIEFVDNVFNAPYEHAVSLCESFIRSGLRARLQSVELNPAYFTHELLSLMEKAGFVGMGLTVESAADPVLQGLRKGFTARDVFQAAELVRAHGLPCIWIFMLGGPGETRETVQETLRFAEENVRPGDAAFFNIGIRVYPGTELESIARRQGVLEVPRENMLVPVFYMSPQVEAAWIRDRVGRSLRRQMNFMSVDSFSLPYLSLIHRTAHLLGIRPPLWRYTRQLRKGLRSVGINA